MSIQDKLDDALRHGVGAAFTSDEVPYINHAINLLNLVNEDNGRLAKYKGEIKETLGKIFT